MNKQVNITKMFEEKDCLHISAPMVRYSKLAFRSLLRNYNCDLCYTPMIVAESFINNINARNSDFSYNDKDYPLIVQFAANNVNNFVQATKLVVPFCDGVDLNCGCPQKWALHEGYGACLIDKPDLLYDIVRQVKNSVPENFSISIKIRVHEDIKNTVEMVRRIEKAGLSFLTVHGRTKDQRCEPVDYNAIALIKTSISIPVVANGDIKTMEDVYSVKGLTNVDGIMCARGLLTNPTLFTGTTATTLQCIEEWIRISTEIGTSFQCFHNHLIYMIEKCQSKAERKFFNSLSSFSSVLNFLAEKYELNI